MSIETLVVALILLVIAYVVVDKLVPAAFRTIGYVIVFGIAVIWVVTHLRALLHCCST